MKLQATILDLEFGHEQKVLLCKFRNKYGDMCFVETEILHSIKSFKILADEGYSATYYYFPVNRYTIINLEVE